MSGSTQPSLALAADTRAPAGGGAAPSGGRGSRGVANAAMFTTHGDSDEDVTPMHAHANPNGAQQQQQQQGSGRGRLAPRHLELDVGGSGVQTPVESEGSMGGALHQGGHSRGPVDPVVSPSRPASRPARGVADQSNLPRSQARGGSGGCAAAVRVKGGGAPQALLVCGNARAACSVGQAFDTSRPVATVLCPQAVGSQQRPGGGPAAKYVTQLDGELGKVQQGARAHLAGGGRRTPGPAPTPERAPERLLCLHDATSGHARQTVQASRRGLVGPNPRPRHTVPERVAACAHRA